MTGQQTPPSSLTKLVSVWITVSLLFVAGQAVLFYGALAGLLIIGSLFTALILIIPIIYFVHKKRKYQSSIVLKLLENVVFLESFSINLFIIGLILEAILSNITYLSLAGFVLCMLVLIILLGKKGEGLITLKLGLLLGISIFLPNYIYLQKGLETVYHNLLHYYPRYLHLDQEGAFILFSLLAATFFAKLFIQIPFLETYVEYNFWRGIRKLFIGGFIWSTVILALSTMTLVSFTYTSSIEYENKYFFIMLENQVGSVFILAVLLILFFSSLIELYQVTRSIRKVPGKGKIPLIGGGLILGVYFYLSTFSILKVFVLFGVVMGMLCAFHFLFLLNHKYIKSRKIDIS